jgi:hypothetical protein
MSRELGTNVYTPLAGFNDALGVSSISYPFKVDIELEKVNG